MPGAGRIFRRKCAPFWDIWPMPPKIEEPRSVIYVDGMHLGRRAVVLIASDERHVLGWHPCRAENSCGWSALMQRLAAPEVVVSDGGDGFPKALRKTWPHAHHQRCIFRAFSQVKRYTTSKPRTQASAELYGHAKALLGITTLNEAQGWMEAFLVWSERWDDFLSERTKTEEGRYVLTHERLVKARRSLARLISAGTPFTYLDPRLDHLAPLPTTNNRIEGGTNAQLRAMLRDHRGLSIEHRLKAIFWCTARAPCLQRKSCVPCRWTALSELYTKGSISRTSYKEPILSGEMPLCGQNCIAPSHTIWTGASPYTLFVL